MNLSFFAIILAQIFFGIKMRNPLSGIYLMLAGFIYRVYAFCLCYVMIAYKDQEEMNMIFDSLNKYRDLGLFILESYIIHNFILIAMILLFLQHDLMAGPPFITDDPEPVEYQHWEFYIASVDSFSSGAASGTCPHFEMNYGAVHNVQLHIIVPMNYIHLKGGDTRFGYGYTELGIKYRLLGEQGAMPQIGTFPIIEIPTINNHDFSSGKVQLYLPIWIQKSWGKFTTYGGGGYWINPGKDNKNWLYTGWEAQYDFSKRFTLGGEFFYHTASSSDQNAMWGINAGGFINFSDKFHFIYSAGHSFKGQNMAIAYAGLLWTI